jgi:hypothetical protein
MLKRLSAPLATVAGRAASLVRSSRRGAAEPAAYSDFADREVTLRVFVVGCPRSGTTLLQCLLAAHPRMLSFPESHFFARILPLPERQREQQLRSFSRAAGLGPLEWDVPRHGRDAAAYIRAFIKLLDRAAALQGRDIWVEKSPIHVRHIDTITEHVGKAKFVHIVRNPVDVIASLNRVGKEFPETWTRTHSLEVCKRRWLKDVHCSLQFRTHPDHHFLRYENLVTHPSEVLGGVCSFLEVAYVESMNGRHAELAPSLILHHERWKAGALEPVRSASPRLTTASSVSESALLSDPQIVATQAAIDAAFPVH